MSSPARRSIIPPPPLGTPSSTTHKSRSGAICPTMRRVYSRSSLEMGGEILGKGKAELTMTNCIHVSDYHSVTISSPSTLNQMKSEVGEDDDELYSSERLSFGNYLAAFHSKSDESDFYRGFTQVLSTDSSQEKVYAKTVRQIVDDFLRGKSRLLDALGP